MDLFKAPTYSRSFSWVMGIKNKRLILLGLLLYFSNLFNRAYNVNIPYKIACKEADLMYAKNKDLNERSKIIHMFLSSYKSPLAAEAKTFVEVSEKNNLDWTLLVSIAGIESLFGKRVPKGSHNPFGWGGGHIYFKDWKQAIETVGKGLATYGEKYKASTIEDIAPIYAPPNYKNWAMSVKFFSNKLNEINTSKSPKHL